MTELGKENEVAETLIKIPEVKECHTVYGIYDTIAKVEAETLQDLKDVIYFKIRPTDSIRSTLTMIVF